MDVAQRLSSMILSLRRKADIKVRQPLSRMKIPVLDPCLREQVEAVKGIVLGEVNIKEIEFVDDPTVITKRIKPNFKTLGPRYSTFMKGISARIAAMTQQEIADIEANGGLTFMIGDTEIVTTREDYEIVAEDMPGWLVANEGQLTVALDITVTEELHREGVARELINRIQNLRKESGLEVTDKIHVVIADDELLRGAVEDFGVYIAAQTLAAEVVLAPTVAGGFIQETEIDGSTIVIAITKI
jgi:isoleucyl-tRNA synthetase